MKKPVQKMNKGNAAILIAVMVILGIFCFEIYSVTHIELKTQTAQVSTVYEKISAPALVIRQEKVVPASESGITVACYNNSDKIKKGGNVGMVFSSEQAATGYSRYVDLEQQLAQYEALIAQTVGQSADLEIIDKDIQQKVVEYAEKLNRNNLNDEQENLNSVLIRRQILIGEQVDLQSYVTALTDEISKYGRSTPDKYITTDVSGVFSTYTDGFEELVDFENVEKMTVDDFKAAKQRVDEQEASSQGNLGKLITGYDWYITALVDSEEVRSFQNGNYVEIALKDDNNTVLKAKIISGAEPELGNDETLLVLRLNVMDDTIAELRSTEIEIIRKKYEGIKIPSQALHVVDGKKGVYVLIASQVKFREVNVIYSENDYVLAEYDSSKEELIHLYDKIITQGKDLEDGKVYT